MNNLLILSSYLLLVVNLVCGDLYMHNMRGSNNRLNEPRATRKENNRLFDSQNNNRGGYNVGDKGSEPAKNQSEQYQMKYFQSSASAATHLELEWTVQHGFGTNDKLNSNFVIQMMCQPDSDDEEDYERLRDGFKTDEQPFKKQQGDETHAEYLLRKNCEVKLDRGLHENFYWYDQCTKRPRNKGLFTAGQIRRNRDSAKFTRQNPNGGKSGYECPEERDYYPYWAPNPWIDIAVLTSNSSDCPRYETESFNTAPKGECVQLYDDTNAKVPKKFLPQHNNEADCNAADGLTWVVINNYLEILEDATTEAECTAKGEELNTAVIFGKTMQNYVKDVCFVPLTEPICQPGNFSRVNHNGNGKGLEMLSFEWNVPHFPSGVNQRCVLRMRYNITTNDYDPSETFADTVPEYFSYKNDNPKINVGKDEAGNDINVQVNVNLEQFGRTFQDRSHVFILAKRPEELKDITIHNLNVRGKRGNIVQVYPAVEYDFTPNELELNKDHALHIQWTGSNSHNNGNPGGDGQTGDAGQGKGGSDRNNMLCLDSLNRNFPMPFDSSNKEKCMFNKISTVLWHFTDKTDKEDIAISAATSGQANSNEELSAMEQINEDLNDAPASFPGVVLKFDAGNYFYMCTRNNAFTNRSQKGRLNVN